MSTTASYSTPVTVRPTTFGAIKRLVQHVRDAGREELVHYAGAAHRDEHAWHVIQCWFTSSTVCEATLQHAAHLAEGANVSQAHLRRYYSTQPGQFAQR